VSAGEKDHSQRTRTNRSKGGCGKGKARAKEDGHLRFRSKMPPPRTKTIPGGNIAFVDFLLLGYKGEGNSRFGLKGFLIVVGWSPKKRTLDYSVEKGADQSLLGQISWDY